MVFTETMNITVFEILRLAFTSCFRCLLSHGQHFINDMCHVISHGGENLKREIINQKGACAGLRRFTKIRWLI